MKEYLSGGSYTKCPFCNLTFVRVKQPWAKAHLDKLMYGEDWGRLPHEGQVEWGGDDPQSRVREGVWTRPSSTSANFRSKAFAGNLHMTRVSL